MNGSIKKIIIKQKKMFRERGGKAPRCKVLTKQPEQGIPHEHSRTPDLLPQSTKEKGKILKTAGQAGVTSPRTECTLPLNFSTVTVETSAEREQLVVRKNYLQVRLLYPAQLIPTKQN